MADSILAGVMQKLGLGGTTPEADATMAAGTDDVKPTIETKNKNPLVTLEMTVEEVGEWWKRVAASRERVVAREKEWDILLTEYLPKVSASGTSEEVRMTTHFRNVQTKIGSLFYRSPELVLTPKEPSPMQDQMPNPMNAMQPLGAPPLPPLTMQDIIPVKQAVLNDKLGPNGVNAGRLMDELLMDVLAWAGIGCAKLGYRCTTKQITRPMMGPDPNFIPPPAPPPPPGTVLGLNTPTPPAPQAPTVPQVDPMTGQPQMETVAVPIFDEYYFRRFSPKKLLLNDDLTSGRIDEDATFVGMDFYISPKIAMKPVEEGGYGLSEDEVSAGIQDDRLFQHPQDTAAGSYRTQGLLRGCEIWAKASIFGTEPHPQALNQLVLFDGIKTRPIVWRPSPDQEFDPMTGKLTPDSMIGFPIRVLSIRDLPDSPFTPSDSAWTNPLIKQLGTWRTQSIQIRDAAIGKYFYDEGQILEEHIEKLKNGKVGEYIGLPSGALANGADKIFGTTAQVKATRDDYNSQEIFKRDIDETLGIGANQAGADNTTVRTATEIAKVSAAINARNDKERSRVIEFYLSGARMLDSLLQRYADEDEYINIAGEEGSQRMQVWNRKVISGRYLYNIAPDSQNHSDTAEDFNQDAKFYNLAAPDPLFNRAYSLARMAIRRGLDPKKVVINPASLGLQPPHGGPAAQGGTVSQHEAGKSGGAPNAPGTSNHREGQMK